MYSYNTVSTLNIYCYLVASWIVSKILLVASIARQNQLVGLDV